MLMTWFTRKDQGLEKPAEGDRHVRTEGLWLKCEGCSQIIWRKTLDENFQVCNKCGHHFKTDAQSRLKILLDGEWKEHDSDLTSTDPLEFVDSKPYKQRLA